MANRGGIRKPGPGKSLGRPPKDPKLARLRDMQAEIELTIEEFRKTLASGAVKSIAEMSRGMPAIMSGLLIKALPMDSEGNVRADLGDTDIQKFLLDKFLKFFQPDMLVVGEQTPVQQMWEQVRDYLTAEDGETSSEPARAEAPVDNVRALPVNGSQYLAQP
jgi:hypothetical protein